MEMVTRVFSGPLIRVETLDRASPLIGLPLMSVIRSDFFRPAFFCRAITENFQYFHVIGYFVFNYTHAYAVIVALVGPLQEFFVIVGSEKTAVLVGYSP